MVSQWCCKFNEGRWNVKDEDQSKCLSESRNDNNIATVLHMVHLNDVEKYPSSPVKKIIVQNSAEIKKAVQQFFASQSSQFYQNGFFCFHSKINNSISVDRLC
ncbi:hypothetical protein TNCV_2322491 [Trichonephila clavipes]|nr:hypothetical protein TNCV_2322491 [Trichonephila clavipes]